MSKRSATYEEWAAMTAEEQRHVTVITLDTWQLRSVTSAIDTPGGTPGGGSSRNEESSE